MRRCSSTARDGARGSLTQRCRYRPVSCAAEGGSHRMVTVNVVVLAGSVASRSRFSGACLRGRRGHGAPALRSGGGQAPPPPPGRGVARHGRRTCARGRRQGRPGVGARAARPSLLPERSRRQEPHRGRRVGHQEKLEEPVPSP